MSTPQNITAPMPRAATAAGSTPTGNDDIHAQHARIVAALKARGRMSCPELAALCDVPSVTKRVCELIALGWPIERTKGKVRTKRGAWRRAAFYALAGGHPQGDLFEPRADLDHGART